MAVNLKTKMKIKNFIVSIAACAVVATFVGCSKNSEPAPGGTNAIVTATDAAKDLAGKAADAAKGVAGQAAAATNAVAAVAGPFTEGIANAKKLIADKDYQGALGELTKLSSLKLSDEQTKIVDGLKSQVQDLIAKGTAGATDAAKGLIGK